MRQSELVVQQIGDGEWRLERDLVWEGGSERFTVGAGFRTNFASVPRPFWWLIPRTGKYTKAAVLHDALWCESKKPDGERRVDPWDADGIFRRTLKELGVSQVRRYVMWAAVRWAAVLRGRFGSRGPIQLIQLTLIALPAAALLLPAGAVVAASLAIFWIVEWLVRAGLMVFGVERSSPSFFWWPFEREATSGERDCSLTVETLEGEG